MAGTEIKLEKISDSFIKANGIQALADRPNQVSLFSGKGGMSSTELKRAFDEISIKLVETVNKIIDYTTSGNVYVPWDDKVNNLTALVRVLKEELLHIIQVPADISISKKNETLYNEIWDHSIQFLSVEEDINRANGRIDGFESKLQVLNNDVIHINNEVAKLNDYKLPLLASKSYVDAKVAELVNSAPEALDTINELSAALGNDPNFATLVLTEIGTIKETLASFVNVAEEGA